MIVIGKPFVSDFFVNTIKENNFPIVSTPEARNMIDDPTLNWITEEEAKVRLKNNPNTALYTNSENTIGWVEKNCAPSNLPGQIKIFKDKIKFRELIQDAFPNYFFKGVKHKDLGKLNLEEIKFPFIVKPAIGFFSVAVHKVDRPDEWDEVLDTIDHEIKKSQGLYPKEVVNTADFIIEEYIEGEEYAIDCYFDRDGKPVVLNILHHVFSSENDVSDRVYSTSKKIMEKHRDGILDFLEMMGDKTNLINFPAHVEVRINDEGSIYPIEVNPLRFGGWCTTGDLSWYAYGINSYDYFFNSKRPDWENILKTRTGKTYSIIVLDNNSGIQENDIASFDYEQLARDFEKPLSLRKIDFNAYSVFGFLFTETTEGNEKELNRILVSNLKKYIRPKKPVTD